MLPVGHGHSPTVSKLYKCAGKKLFRNRTNLGRRTFYNAAHKDNVLLRGREKRGVASATKYLPKSGQLWCNSGIQRRYNAVPASLTLAQPCTDVIPSPGVFWGQINGGWFSEGACDRQLTKSTDLLHDKTRAKWRLKTLIARGRVLRLHEIQESGTKRSLNYERLVKIFHSSVLVKMASVQRRRFSQIKTQFSIAGPNHKNTPVHGKYDILLCWIIGYHIS